MPRNVERVEQLLRPGARREVAEQCAAGVADIGHLYPSELPSKIILGQQQVSPIPIALRLMAAQPEQLGGRGAGVGCTAGDRPQALAPDSALDQPRLGCAT